MRVLITGIAGFVGRHLATHLAEATDWQLCGLVRSTARRTSVGTIPLIEADLTDAAVSLDLSERWAPPEGQLA